jgi:hypothetical protein
MVIGRSGNFWAEAGAGKENSAASMNPITDNQTGEHFFSFIEATLLLDRFKGR